MPLRFALPVVLCSPPGVETFETAKWLGGMSKAKVAGVDTGGERQTQTDTDTERDTERQRDRDRVCVRGHEPC